MTDPLAKKIAHVAAIRICPHCEQAIAPGALVCECRTARGQLPHTEWPPEMKRYLVVRAIERQQGRMSEQYLFEKLLLDEYRGKWVGPEYARRMLPLALTITDAFPYAAGDAAAWVAAGCPTTFTL